MGLGGFIFGKALLQLHHALAPRVCSGVGWLFCMWLLDPTLRRSAYRIGRTSVAWATHRRAPCEKAIRCNHYDCFGTLQCGDGCGIIFCIQLARGAFAEFPAW